jgi:site-specific DNA recombinase
MSTDFNPLERFPSSFSGQQPKAMRRVAIYARFSTDKQDARSIEDQVRRCRAAAAGRGFVVVTEYADAAISGSHTVRANLQRMLADAKRKAFDSLLIDDLSRLARDLGDTWQLVFRDLAGQGVSVLDCTTGMFSDAKGARLTFGALALVNDTFLELVRTETHRGLEGRALAGFSAGGKTYGFTTVPETNPSDPLHPRKRRVIEPDEAAIVVRIFAMFADGAGAKKIAATLNDEGVRAPHDGGKGNKRSRGWGHTTIRHMLRNENYVGVFTWNRHKFFQIPGTNSYRHVPRPESEHVRKELQELRVVPADLWTKVQRLNGPKRTRKTAAIGSGKSYLLAGLVKCGLCGGAISVVSRRYKKGVGYTALGCGTHHSRGQAICANGRSVSERKLTQAVVGALRERLLEPDLAARFIAGVKRV